MSIGTLAPTVNAGNPTAESTSPEFVPAGRTFTEVLPERKASKHSAMQWTPNDTGDFSPVAGLLTIDTDRARVRYAVAEFPTDFDGRGFVLAKMTEGTDPESESYSVFCGRTPFVGDHCTCKGWNYKRTCKHVDAARALLANGWL